MRPRGKGTNQRPNPLGLLPLRSHEAPLLPGPQSDRYLVRVHKASSISPVLNYEARYAFSLLRVGRLLHPVV